MTASGGTGAYDFELENPDSAGLLNGLTGSYLAPGVPGWTDTIVLTDAGCLGEATAEVHVSEPLAVHPSLVEVGVEQSLTFLTTGGSPELYFEAVLLPSGGSVTLEGVYTAGSVFATDQLRCTDAETGQSVDVFVNVIEAPSLWPRPPLVAVPLDATFDLSIDGGSGHFDLVSDGSAVTVVSGTMVRGDAPGSATITATDVFTGLVTEISVTVIAPLGFEVERAGDALSLIHI